MQKNGFLQTTVHTLKISFLNGLVTILPLTLTIGLFNLSFRIIINWFKPIQDFFESPISFLNSIPYKAIANELLLLILGILVVGVIFRVLILRTLIDHFENLIYKLPLVRPVYSGIKQLIKAFSVHDKATFKKVVLVEFPRSGIYSIGFLTSELPRIIAPRTQEKFYNIFIPTTPNPTTGFFVILPEQEIQTLSLSPQEAMAMIISGGIILPESIIEKNQ